MCCDLPGAVLVPPAVAEMLAEYRRLLAASPVDLGKEAPEAAGLEYGRYLNLADLWFAAADTRDWSAAVRRCIPDPPPRGLLVVHVRSGGIETTTGPLLRLLPGETREVGVLLDSLLTTTSSSSSRAGRAEYRDAGSR